MKHSDSSAQRPRKTRRVWRWVLFLPGLLVLLLLLAAWLFPNEPQARRSARPADAGAIDQALLPIHIVDHGWHTSLVLPAEVLFEQVPGLRARFAGRHWLELGWGDTDFYQAREITPGLALGALFLPSPAVLYVVGFDEAPAQYFETSAQQEWALDAIARQDLLDYIVRSFQLDAGQQARPLGAGIYGDAQFYAAHGHYSFINTCNTWTAKALYSAGLDLPATRILTASGLMRALRDETERKQNENRPTTDPAQKNDAFRP